MSTENVRLIENSVLVSLPDDSVAKEQTILDLATRLRTVFPVGDAEFNVLIKRLHAKLAITMDTGVVLIGEEEHTPWLNSRRATIDPFYSGSILTVSPEERLASKSSRHTWGGH